MTARARIGLRQIQNLKAGETIWDTTVRGFGARRQKSEAVAYVLSYRTRSGRARWYTIGRHGAPWTPDMARAEAQRLLGRIANGKDPAAQKKAERHAQSVAELCDVYLADAEAGRLLTRRQTPKKYSTLLTDRGRIASHIKPLLGRIPVAAVTRADVEAFMHDVAAGKTARRTKTKPRGLANVRGGRGTASRTVGLLGAVFGYAVRHGLRSDNPVRGVIRFADGRRNRRLTEAEYGLLGEALRAEGASAWPPFIVAVRFLGLTGWRRGEVLGLRWSEVDLARRTARLSETKTGYSLRPLSNQICEALRDLPRAGELVFSATRGGGLMSGFPKMWLKLVKAHQLPPDVTPHVLRHSFASMASDLGYSEPTIAALIGHKGHTMTSRYLHAADAVLLAAGDAVAHRIAESMGDRKHHAEVIQLRPASTA